MSVTDHVYARALARQTELQRELRELEVFLSLYRQFSSEDPGEAAAITAPIDPGEYDGLLDCWRSGQVTPRQWQLHLEDEAFQRWVLAQEIANHVPDVQRDEADKPTPSVPAATSPASAMEPHTCGSGEARDCAPTASPSIEPWQDGRGRQDGLTMADKCARILPVLREAAEPDGHVRLTQGPLSIRTGIPRGSIAAVLKKLQAQGHLRREGGVTRMLDRAENTESRQDDAAIIPSAPTAVEKIVVPAAETAAPAPKPVKAHVPSIEPGHDPPETKAPRADTNGHAPVKASFDSAAPKPEWDLGDKSRILAQAPASRGAPDRLAVAGTYLLCGRQSIRLGKEQAIIMARLIKDWGSPVRGEALAEELMSRSTVGMSAKVALAQTGLKHLGTLNGLLKTAQLMVIEDEGKWRLQVRKEAGVPA